MNARTANPLCLYSFSPDKKRDKIGVYHFQHSDGSPLISIDFEGDHRKAACELAVGLLQGSMDELYSRRDGQ